MLNLRSYHGTNNQFLQKYLWQINRFNSLICQLFNNLHLKIVQLISKIIFLTNQLFIQSNLTAIKLV